MAAPPPILDRNEAVDQTLALRVGRAWRELRRGAAMSKVHERIGGSGSDALEFGQIDTLDLLVQRPAWRMSELADALRVDPSTATRAVQRLERSGFAERVNDPIDARVVNVSATDAGRRRHESFAAARLQLLTTMLGAFDSEERDTLATLLERFVVALDRYVAEP